MHKIANKISLIILMSLSITACEKVFDQAYYAENCKEAQKVVDRCKSGDLSGDNCKNASQGLSKFNANAFSAYMRGETKYIQPTHANDDKYKLSTVKHPRFLAWGADILLSIQMSMPGSSG